MARLLSTDNRLLNPLNEMKKKFGSAIVEQFERESHPNAQAAMTNMSAQRYVFVSSCCVLPCRSEHVCASRRTYQSLQQQQHRPSTRIAKQNAFIAAKAAWPVYFKFGKRHVSTTRDTRDIRCVQGLSMRPSSSLSETTINTGNYFQFEYDRDYQRLQMQFLDFVDLHDLQGIMVSLLTHLE
jgi:hypothetical protein